MTPSLAQAPVAAQTDRRLILTVNGGSSSIKVSLAPAAADQPRLFAATLDRIGTADATFTIHHDADATPHAKHLTHTSFDDALGEIISALKLRIGTATVLGIGHRVVHGGLTLLEHQPITPAVLAELKIAQPLDLAHLPREIALIEAFEQAFPCVPQVACFDTAFHRDMPTVSQLLPIPRRFAKAGLRRLGFHGLSYTSLMTQLAAIAGPDAQGRVILAHLGAGASMAAVHGGKPIDTTMSFTPLSGLVMATRPGDLDPGLILYLLKSEHLSVDELTTMLSSQSGLLGLSECCGDARDLLARRAVEPPSEPFAAQAMDVFCTQARKHLCALAGSMGGIDTIVFSGGIGEHSAPIRAAICEGLEFLGAWLDPIANAAGHDVISAHGSAVTVRIIPTDEERVLRDIVRAIVPESPAEPQPPAHAQTVPEAKDSWRNEGNPN